jgi:hypothetical protein
MLSRIRSRLTYANVVASLALFLVLSGGTAVALTGSNTVFSDDIVDNQVGTADVRNDTLAGGGLTAADLAPGSVAGSEVKDNSVTGADVKESSLGRVPLAGNANSLDGLDSTDLGPGVMGGVMTDMGVSDVANGTDRAPIGMSTPTATGPFVAPAGGFVARDLKISLDQPNDANEVWSFAFTPSPSPSQALSCTVQQGASSCSDTTHAITVSAGQRYAIRATAEQNSVGTVDVSFGWRATSP